MAHNNRSKSGEGHGVYKPGCSPFSEFSWTFSGISNCHASLLKRPREEGRDKVGNPKQRTRKDEPGQTQKQIVAPMVSMPFRDACRTASYQTCMWPMLTAYVPSGVLGSNDSGVQWAHFVRIVLPKKVKVSASLLPCMVLPGACCTSVLQPGALIMQCFTLVPSHIFLFFLRQVFPQSFVQIPLKIPIVCSHLCLDRRSCVGLSGIFDILLN